MSEVSDLLKTKFTEHDLAVQREIVRSGPPQPKLPDLLLPITVGSMTLEQSFDVSLYARFPWLAGCATRSKLFCWPCLLYGQQCKDTQVWSRHGVNNLKELVELARKHSTSKSHIVTSVLLRRFKCREIEGIEVASGSVEIVNRHNQAVAELRHLLAYYASLLALIAYEDAPLVIDQHTMECDSNLMYFLYSNIVDDCYGATKNPKRNVKMPVLEAYLPKLFDEEPRLKNHLANPTSPFHPLDQLQLDLAKIMAEMYREVIQRDLARVEFVSLQLYFGNDEKCEHTIRIGVFLNYVLDETLMGRYLDSCHVPPSGITVAMLNSAVAKAVEQFAELEDKLISITFDTLPISTTTFDQFRSSLLERFPHLVITPDLMYSARMNLLRNIRAAFDQNLDFPLVIRETLDNIMLLQDYIYNNDARLEKSRVMIHPLDCHILRDELEYYRNFLQSGEFMRPLHKSHAEIQQDMKRMLGVSSSFESILLIYILGEWIVWFQGIDLSIGRGLDNMETCVELVSTAFEIMTPESIDFVFEGMWKKAKKRFFLLKDKYDFDSKLTTDNFVQFFPVEKQAPFKLFSKQVAYLVKKQIDAMYGNLHDLLFFDLLSSKYLSEHQKQYPDKLAANLAQRGSWFDLDRLRGQLSKLYEEKLFGKESIYELYQFLRSQGLERRFSEVTKLARFMLTISPELCQVSLDQLNSPALNFQHLSNTFEGKSSDEWNFVVMNCAITAQLHPRYCFEMNTGQKLFRTVQNLNFLEKLNYVCPQVTPERVAVFRDATTEEVCHRYSLYRGLDSLAYHLTPNC